MLFFQSQILIKQTKQMKIHCLKFLKQNTKAFSLIEMLVVVVIAGVIVLVVANIPNAMGLIGKSKHESIAKEVAVQKIESLRSQTYANLANGSSSINDVRVTGLPNGAGTTLIEDCPIEICPTADTIKKITVTVSWSESQETKSVVLTTLISEGGLQ